MATGKDPIHELPSESLVQDFAAVQEFMGWGHGKKSRKMCFFRLLVVLILYLFQYSKGAQFTVFIHHMQNQVLQQVIL